MEERDVEVKMRVIQLHAAGISDRQIARETKVPPSTVYRWIKQNNEVKQIGEILEELAQRYGKQAFSNRQIKRKYASRSPDTVVRWLNKTGRDRNSCQRLPRRADLPVLPLR